MPVICEDGLGPNARLQKDIGPQRLEDQFVGFAQGQALSIADRLIQHRWNRLRLLELAQGPPLLGRHAQVSPRGDVLQHDEAVDRLALPQIRSQVQRLRGKQEIDVHGRNQPDTQPPVASLTAATSCAFSKGFARNLCSRRSSGHHDTSVR